MNYLLIRLNGLIATFIYFYSILIVLRIFMSWLPSINWDAQPMKAIRLFTDVYLDLVRRFIPPIGGLDFSPIVALLFLSVLQELFVHVTGMLS